MARKKLPGKTFNLGAIGAGAAKILTTLKTVRTVAQDVSHAANILKDMKRAHELVDAAPRKLLPGHYRKQ